MLDENERIADVLKDYAKLSIQKLFYQRARSSSMDDNWPPLPFSQKEVGLSFNSDNRYIGLLSRLDVGLISSECIDQGGPAGFSL